MRKLILGISIALLMTSCTLGLSNKKDVNPITKSESSTTNYTEDIDKMSGKIRSTEEFQSCMKQQSTMCIQTVGMKIAQKTKDAEFCKELTNPDQQSSCEFAVTMINAQEKTDEKVCDILKNPKYLEQCKIQIYRQTAISKNDITICNQIDVLLLSWAKTDEKNQNHGIQKDQCIMQFVMNNMNSKLFDCQWILDESSYQTCQKTIKDRAKSIEKSTSK